MPLTVAVAQPLMEVPLSLKFTLPVGAVPVTVALNVTLAPEVDGLSELISAVVLVVMPWFTTCDNGPLLDPALPESPL